MRMRSLAGWLAVLTLTVLVGAGCHPGEIDEIAELDIVVTFYDETVDFGAFGTYAMEDTIYNLNVLQDPGEEDTLDRRFDAQIIAQVKAEMADRGYALADTSSATDLRIGLGAFDTPGTLVYANLPWWGGSSGRWWPSWGSTDFTEGTLVVLLADWAGRDPATGEFDPLWTGGLDGVLEESRANTSTRLENGIAQMYRQSPYLKSNVTELEPGEVR